MIKSDHPSTDANRRLACVCGVLHYAYADDCYSFKTRITELHLKIYVFERCIHIGDGPQR